MMSFQKTWKNAKELRKSKIGELEACGAEVPGGEEDVIGGQPATWIK